MEANRELTNIVLGRWWSLIGCEMPPLRVWDEDEEEDWIHGKHSTFDEDVGCQGEAGNIRLPHRSLAVLTGWMSQRESTSKPFPGIEYCVDQWYHNHEVYILFELLQQLEVIIQAVPRTHPLASAAQSPAVP